MATLALRIVAACFAAHLLATAPASRAAEPIGAPGDLTVGEGLTNPLGYYDSTPSFSWKLPVENNVLSQSAYQVVVGTTRDELTGQPELWDSGRVSSDQSTFVPYGGPPLKSRQKVYWAVRYWDQAGNASQWSSPAEIELGLLSNADWSAQWIMPAGPKEKLEIVQATYGVLDGSSDQQADVTEQLRQKVKGNRLVATADNSLAGKDPAINIAKQLRVKFALDGQQQEIVVSENETLNLPKNATTLSEPVHYYRREFPLSGVVKQARLHVTAKGLYEVSINGNRVGDDALVPGWTNYNKRIETSTYDVTDLLQADNCAVGAKVGMGWYAGKLAWRQQLGHYGPTPQLLLQLEVTLGDGTTRTLVSDASWKVTSEGPIRSSSIYDGEIYNSNREMPGWDSAGYDDTDWGSVEATPVESTPLLSPKRFRPVRAVERIATQSITEPTSGRHVFDLGQNMVGWAKLSLPLQADERITVRFAEMLNPDGTLYTDNYRSAKSTDVYHAAGDGPVEWEPTFTFHGFRYVELSGFSRAVTPQENWVEGVVLSSEMEQIGQFTSSHKMLNKLQSNITWGQRGNFVDIPTDCPQRDERLGWTGDAQAFCPTAMFNFDTHAFWASWLQSMRDEQLEDGRIPHVIPNVLGNDSSPGWADAAVVVPWEVYLRTGDRSVLEDNFEMMQRWVGWYRANSKRNLATATGFGDWLQPYPSPDAMGGGGTKGDTPQALIATAYYAYGTGVLQKTAKLLGKPDLADEYAKQYQEVRSAFTQEFFDSQGKLKAKQPTQTGYLLPLGLGLLEGELQRQAQENLAELVEKADNHLGTGFLGTPLLNAELDRAGRSDLAYAVLFTDSYPSWFYSIHQGATTMWERWNSYSHEDGFGPVGMNSFNHYAYGAVGRWMYERIAGLAPDADKPGYRHLNIRPLPGGPLSSASATLKTPYGHSESSWNISEQGQLNLKAVVPPNATATVTFPFGSEDSIQLAGESLANGPLAGSVSRDASGNTSVEVAAGTYEFRIQP